jgi:hypothetical protein
LSFKASTTSADPGVGWSTFTRFASLKGSVTYTITAFPARAWP